MIHHYSVTLDVFVPAGIEDDTFSFMLHLYLTHLKDHCELSAEWMREAIKEMETVKELDMEQAYFLMRKGVAESNICEVLWNTSLDVSINVLVVRRFINVTLTFWKALNGKRHRPVRQAIPDITHGRFIGHTAPSGTSRGPKSHR